MPREITTGHRIYIAAYYHARCNVFPLPDHAYFLDSYWYINSQRIIERIRADGMKIFLDSGAFTAMTKGVDIPLDQYAGFIKRNRDVIEIASVLDGIGDPALTLENQKRLEDMDCEVVPCFHYGEDPKYLEDYLAAGYEYISLGGMVKVTTNQLQHWLDYVWDHYLTNERGMPVVKVHGFGMTTLRLMLRYPWYSVDSTTWMMAANYGWIYWPTKSRGEGKLVISSKHPTAKDLGKHYDTLSTIEKEEVTRTIEARGYVPEELRTVHWRRDQWNIEYFHGLSDRPLHPFIREQEGLFW